MLKELQDFISTSRANLTALEALVSSHPCDLPTEMFGFSTGESHATLFIWCTRCPNEHGREKVLSIIGDAFGRDGWTARFDRYDSKYDWTKNIDGVKIKVVGAEKSMTPETFPVPPAKFPVLLEDVKRADDPYGLDREAARNEAERSEPFI